jgi:hypothetical protein
MFISRFNGVPFLLLLRTRTAEGYAPRRFIAGADAIATTEQKLADLSTD